MIMVSAGYNNLSSYLRDDLDELLASSERGYLPPQGSNRALVLVTHLAKPASSTLQMYGTPTDICVIRASRDFRGQVLRDTLKTFSGNLMLTDADTFRTVLEYVASEFPSDSYGMVYSSHATGWLPCGYYAKSDVAIGWSEAPGNRENSPLGVDLSEWSDGIPVKAIGEETRIESGSRVSNDMDIIDFAASIPMKLDYLIFDACLMGGIEVAYQLRNVTRFVGFSQAEVGAEGFCYDTMAGRLLCEQKVAGPLAVCRDYFESCASQSSSVYRSATVSYVDCSRLDALADVSGLSPSYISKLFHSETGITIAQYIQNKRIDAAKNLLIFTEYTTTDIANYLNFSSESYFINVFRRNCGLTPKKFRALHYRSNFVDKEDAEESIAQVK